MAKAKILTELGKFAADFKTLSAWLGKGAIVAPIVAGPVLALAPPWPSAGFVNSIVGIVQAVVLLAAFFQWRGGRSIVPGIKTYIAVGAIFFILLIVYLCLWSTL